MSWRSRPKGESENVIRYAVVSSGSSVFSWNLFIGKPWKELIITLVNSCKAVNVRKQADWGIVFWIFFSTFLCSRTIFNSFQFWEWCSWSTIGRTRRREPPKIIIDLFKIIGFDEHGDDAVVVGNFPILYLRGCSTYFAVKRRESLLLDDLNLGCFNVDTWHEQIRVEFFLYSSSSFWPDAHPYSSMPPLQDGTAAESCFHPSFLTELHFWSCFVHAEDAT